MMAATMEETRNAVTIESTVNSATAETFDVWTDYYFLQAAQILSEHKEAGAHESSNPEEG